MSQHTDHIVIGGGAMGLATTWQLAKHGQQVHLLERFAAHHTRGASHGSTRNLNNAYATDLYLDLFDHAVELWRTLEADTGATLLGLHGLVTHGEESLVAGAYEALSARGADISLLSAESAAARWQGMRFAGDTLLGRQAGIVYAARALDALEAAATAAGAVISRGVQVLSITPEGDGAVVEIRTADGEIQRLHAGHVTVTAGAWTEPLLGTLLPLPQLTVTEEHPAHFAPRNDALVWPSFNHLLTPDQLARFSANVYGMPSPGEGVKVGFHCVGEVINPDDRTFSSSDAQRAVLREYVSEWFPGLNENTAQEISCTYTSTPTGDFILDTVGPITVGAGFSGHGFKFTPAIGRVLAEAAIGTALPPEPFRLAAHTAHTVHDA